MWQDDMIAALVPPNPSEVDIFKAQIIKARHFPEHLYRYQRVSACSLASLEQGSPWLSDPTKFNDPFDSMLCLQIDRLFRIVLRTEWRNLIGRADLGRFFSNDELAEIGTAEDILLELAKRAAARSSSDPAQAVQVASALTDAIGALSDKFLRPRIERWRSGLRVCCFSEIKDSILMWAHYADDHRGICAEHDIGLWRREKRPCLHALWPVVYRDEMFDATPYWEAPLEAEVTWSPVMVAACLIKAKQWEYEREWRLVFPLGESLPEGPIPVPEPSAIYLGARISEESQRVVRSVAAAKGIPIRRMRMLADRFELEEVGD